MEGSDPAHVDAIVSDLLALSDQMSSTMFRLMSKQMDKADLSMSRFNALRVIRQNEPLTMSGLAEQLRVSTAAVTSIVDKLEDEALAQRVRSKEDRRQVLVEITPRGREAVQSVIDVRADFIRYMLENLSPEMREQWLTLYREISRLLEKRAAAAPSEPADD